jgi:hypothetical protein
VCSTSVGFRSADGGTHAASATSTTSNTRMRTRCHDSHMRLRVAR